MKIGTSNALYRVGRAIGRASVAVEDGAAAIANPLTDHLEAVRAGFLHGRREGKVRTALPHLPQSLNLRERVELVRAATGCTTSEACQLLMDAGRIE